MTISTAINRAASGDSGVFALGTGLAPRGDGVAFSPATLFAGGEQGFWYDPSDISTLFQDIAGTIPVTAAGQAVARINDKSGRGFNALQNTLANCPLYQVDGFGKAYLGFDGVDDFMNTSAIAPGTDKVQVFTGLRKTSDAAIGVVLETSPNAGTTDGTFCLFAPLAAGSTQYAARSRGTAAITINATGFPAGTAHVVSAFGDISAPNVGFRVNGDAGRYDTTTQGTGNYTNQPVFIGMRNGNALPYSGRIYGLILRYGANLSAGTIASAETWMNGKTGAY